MRNLATDEPTQRTALGYLRISDKSQIEGESKATQKEYIQRYAERENIKVIGWYYDEARSGKNADREELQNMLRVALTSKKKIDHVIVYKMNRASRDLPTYVRDIFLTLASKGITVRSATEPFDDTPFGRFMQHLHVLIAQLDNEQKSEMVVHNMARVAEQGYWQGRPLRGYRTIRVSAGGSTKHTTLEKTEEADRITDILLRFNRGDYFNIRTLSVCHEHRGSLRVRQAFDSRDGDEVAKEYRIRWVRVQCSYWIRACAWHACRSYSAGYL